MDAYDRLLCALAAREVARLAGVPRLLLVAHSDLCGALFLLGGVGGVW